VRPDARGFTVLGELTFRTARVVAQAGRQVIRSSSEREITADCSGVSRGDSAGLAVLLDWYGLASRSGKTLRLANVPAAILAIAEISELDELLASAS
jgi:phospholipid transport system transporter-binding protein